MRWKASHALCLIFALSLTSEIIAQAITKGFVTFYTPVAVEQNGEGQSGGACGFGNIDAEQWPFGNIVSLGQNNSIVNGIGANRLGCGQCIQATCIGSDCVENAQPVTLLVTDSCGCQDDQINVPAPVFLQSFGRSRAVGQTNVTFQSVDCNPIGTIGIKVLQARQGGGNYIAFILLNLGGRGELSGVDIRPVNNSTWRSLVNTYGNVWEGSNFGDAPLDVRITPFGRPPLVALSAIPRLEIGNFSTNVQISDSPVSAPLALSIPVRAPAPARARPPRYFDDSSTASAPTSDQQTVVYENAQPPSISILGVRISQPLYYAPADSSTLGAYPNISFYYTECTSNPPNLNVSIDRLMVPAQNSSGALRWAIHAIDYVPFQMVGQTQIYRLVDYSFFNLETGEYAQLYWADYITLTNASFTGSIPVLVEGSTETIYPKYMNTSALQTPDRFTYSLLLPPGPNQQPTAEYLDALKSMYYYLSTLTLGNSGNPSANLTCTEPYAALGPWADYLRGILANLSPSNEIVGYAYDNIPLGPTFQFQDTSFVIRNAQIGGSVINTTTQLQSQDCGSFCRSRSSGNATTLPCSAWLYCESIVGCGNTPYQSCALKASTPTSNVTNLDGSLNFVQNSSTRFSSGTLILPPPSRVSLIESSLNISKVSTTSNARP